MLVGDIHARTGVVAHVVWHQLLVQRQVCGSLGNGDFEELRHVLPIDPTFPLKAEVNELEPSFLAPLHCGGLSAVLGGGAEVGGTLGSGRHVDQYIL